jgi:hypothetical protein
VKQGLRVGAVPREHDAHGPPPRGEGTEANERVPPVVAGTDNGHDPASREEPMDDGGHRSPGGFHEGGLGNAQILDGEAIQLGRLATGGSPDGVPAERPDGDAQDGRGDGG